MASPCCPICCEPFTDVRRKPVECHRCARAACTECCQRFLLLESSTDAECMSCRAPWPRDFLDANFSKAFVNKDFKAHREQVLFEREQALLPASQHMVEHWNRAEDLRRAYQASTEMYNLLANEMARLKRRRDEAQAEIRQLEGTGYQRPYRRAGGGGGGEEEPERAHFVRACPAADCRGFLSSAWKCGTCSIWVCPECHGIKGLERDAADHECDPDDVATAQLLQRDTKPCPKCASMITKIDGCFDPHTPILMYDGGIKTAKAIEIGDILVGDDGLPRTVTDTCSGNDVMYEVSQNNGTSYVVNSKHKLVVKFSGERVPYWSETDKAWVIWWVDPLELKRKCVKTPNREDLPIITHSDTYEITIDDFLKMKSSLQRAAMGFKSLGVDFWGKTVVRVDPYMMGLWLGDGINTGDCITTADPEILNYIYSWCVSNGAELVHEEAYKFRIRRKGGKISRDAIGKGASCATCKACKIKRFDICDMPIQSNLLEQKDGNVNPLKNQLGVYNLIKNKHIPKDYIINDRETRLGVLAGFIDSDGSVSNDGKRIVIIQKNQCISRDIIFIARSLGFSVHVTMKTKKNMQLPGTRDILDYDDQYCINISGKNINEIPTIIHRKKCMPSMENKDSLRTGISIRQIGRGEYVGWSIDGNMRFVLPDFTVVRNCDQMWCVQCHTAFSWRTGRQVNGTVHNPHFYEWQRRQNGGVAPRVPGDDPCDQQNQGRLPEFFYVTQRLPQDGGDIRRSLFEYHRIVLHVEYVQRATYRVAEQPDNSDLRLKYLLRQIDEVEWKRRLQQREKKRLKDVAALQILEQFIAVGTEIFRLITRGDIQPADALAQLDDLRTFANENIVATEKRFSMKIDRIPVVR